MWTHQPWLWVWGDLLKWSLSVPSRHPGQRGVVLSRRERIWAGRDRAPGARTGASWATGRGMGTGQLARGWRTSPGLWAGVAGRDSCRTVGLAKSPAHRDNRAACLCVAALGSPRSRLAICQGPFWGGGAWLERSGFGASLHASQRWRVSRRYPASLVLRVSSANRDQDGTSGSCGVKENG